MTHNQKSRRASYGEATSKSLPKIKPSTKANNANPLSASCGVAWYAIRTRQPLKTAPLLADKVEELFLPTELRRSPLGRKRERPSIPHVLFIRTDPQTALSLETQSRQPFPPIPRLWIYRYPQTREIQPISDASIHLLRLLTNSDPDGCHIYAPRTFTPGQRVRVTGGPFEGYEGQVKRIKKNRHVIIEIQGLCMVILPYIHPDLLSMIEDH